MGCSWSKASVAPASATEPRYAGVKQTQGLKVTILWDADEIECPPDNYTSLQFLNALHKVRSALFAPFVFAIVRFTCVACRCLCKMRLAKIPVY